MIFNTDPRQLVLLAIALLISAYLIITRHDRWLLAWVCFTISIHLFDTTLITNLPAARLVGLLLIPRTIQLIPVVARTIPGRALIIQYGYLVVLGVLFGFIFPWSDGGIERMVNQMAPGRALIYLIRTAVDISLAFFIAEQIIKLKRPDIIVKYFLFGTSVAALGGILEYVTNFDWYGTITGLNPYNYEFRMRGFNFEPRGLGLIAVYGLLLSLVLYSRRHSWRLLALIGLHAVALFLAGSTSAIIVFATAAMALFAFDRRCRGTMLILLVLAVLAFGGLVGSQSMYFLTFEENAQSRLTTDHRGQTETLIEDIALRLDVLDGPPLLFLVSNPWYVLFGAGPGLIPLPAHAYISDFPYLKEIREKGVNSPPMIGGLLELSNAGIIGLMLWIIICISSLKAFNHLAERGKPEDGAWSIGRSTFILVVAGSLVQTSVSSIWPVFMGSGIGAAYLMRLYRLQSITNKDRS
jgi:hypothetical protein